MLRAVEFGEVALVRREEPSFKLVDITERRALAASDLKLLIRLLTDVNSWFYCKKRCMPRDTAIIRLSGLAGYLNLSVDIPCAGWLLMPQGTRRAGGFFDPVRDEVRGILKRAFPDFASTGKSSMWKQGAIAKLAKTNHQLAENSSPPSTTENK